MWWRFSKNPVQETYFYVDIFNILAFLWRCESVHAHANQHWYKDIPMMYEHDEMQVQIMCFSGLNFKILSL